MAKKNVTLMILLFMALGWEVKPLEDRLESPVNGKCFRGRSACRVKGPASFPLCGPTIPAAATVSDHKYLS